MRVLAIDQGTSGTKAVVFDEDGTALSSSTVSVATSSAGGGVEQSPDAMWRSVVRAGRAALRQARVDVDAVGLANQGETVLAWDGRDGRPTSSAINWQDRRAVEVISQLSNRAQEIKSITGLPLDPYFAAAKIAWLRRRVGPSPRITTSDAWLAYRLAGAYVTDASTASRTQLMDLDDLAWSEVACTAFGIDISELPRIVSSAMSIGETSVFGPTLPLTGMCVDQGAALFGQGGQSQGAVKCTYGTGAFLVANTGFTSRRSRGGLSTSVAWQVAGSTTHCIDGQVYTAGSAIDWLRDVGLIKGKGLPTVLADEEDEVFFVPALAGLGGPFWRPDVTASLVGFTSGTSALALVTAVIRGIACAVATLAAVAAQDLGEPLSYLRADGGLTRSAALMQEQADVLQLPVEVAGGVHTTALGIAALASVGGGDEQAGHTMVANQQIDRYLPRIGPSQARERLERWRAAVDGAITFADSAAIRHG